MATIQNERDALLQAASPRVVPVAITIDKVAGLKEALRRVRIKASATTLISGGSGQWSTPRRVTLNAVLEGGLTGAVTWQAQSPLAQSALNPSGPNCTVSGYGLAPGAYTVIARVEQDGQSYEAQIVLTVLATLAGKSQVNASEILGKLGVGQINGLGALATLGSVDLSNATVTGALAADRIGAGQLAAGVIYAGAINANQVTAGTFTGLTFRTAASGRRVEIDAQSNGVRIYGPTGATLAQFDTSGNTRVLDITGGAIDGVRAHGRNAIKGEGTAVGVHGIGPVGVFAEGPGGTGLYAKSNSNSPSNAAVLAKNNVGLALSVETVMRFSPSRGLTGAAVFNQDGCLYHHITRGLLLRHNGKWHQLTMTEI